MARKIFGDDRRRLTSLQADLDSIAVRDTRAAAADPSAGKVVFFPQADTALQAALTAVRTRITNLLAMQTT